MKNNKTFLLRRNGSSRSINHNFEYCYEIGDLMEINYKETYRLSSIERYEDKYIYIFWEC